MSTRRTFIAGLGAAAAWPLMGRAQQGTAPVIAIISGGARADTPSRYVSAFNAALAENGYVDGQNVVLDYQFLHGRFDALPALLAELVRRRVAVIATPASVAASLAAKAATATTPIVFGVNDNPVKLGLVASIARPGSNLTGMNFFGQETASKRLRLLHELMPGARRVAVLINPSNSVASETTLPEVRAAAAVIGLSIDILEASSAQEIESAFVTVTRERIGAIFIASDTYFTSRRVQFATLANRHGIATSAFARDFVEAGGLMSYGTDLAEVWRQIGSYTGQILKGAKPADLPVVQSTKFEFVVNLQTARALGLTVPPNLLAIADEVIE
jgi:putative ABC transport system substrate-binding protein